MSPRRILAILTKDLRDAWRDGRIVVLLLLPIGVGVLTTIANEERLPMTSVAVVDRTDWRVSSELRTIAGKTAKLELSRAADAAAARRLVAAEKVDVAVVVGASGAARAEILLAQNASPASRSLVDLVPVALARAAGREPPPRPRVEVEVVAAVNQKPVDVIGGQFTALFSILLFVIFVALMVVPTQTAEELETGTFGALRLAATSREILAAKALAGYVYGAAGAGLTVALTGLEISEPLRFYGATAALIVTLVGFGLLLGLLLPNTSAINTYAGFLIAPLVFLAGAVFTFNSGITEAILDVLPVSQAVKLLADGVSPQQPFSAGPLAWLVVVAWALAGYGILARIAARREL